MFSCWGKGWAPYRMWICIEIFVLSSLKDVPKKQIASQHHTKPWSTNSGRLHNKQFVDHVTNAAFVYSHVVTGGFDKGSLKKNVFTRGATHSFHLSVHILTRAIRKREAINMNWEKRVAQVTQQLLERDTVQIIHRKTNVNEKASATSFTKPVKRS